MKYINVDLYRCSFVFIIVCSCIVPDLILADPTASPIHGDTANRLTALRRRLGLALVDLAEFFLRWLVHKVVSPATGQVALVDTLQLVAAAHRTILLRLYHAVFVEVDCTFIGDTLAGDKDGPWNALDFGGRSFQNVRGRLVADATNPDLLLLKQLLLKLMLILRQNAVTIQCADGSGTDRWKYLR